MAKVKFMSVRWLNLHVKKIIWAIVILFLSSIFIIGFGSSFAQKSQKERSKNVSDAEGRAIDAQNAVPRELRGKIDLPVAHISFPTKTASLTTSISLKEVWKSVKNTPEYQQLAQMPDSIKSFYGKMLKERALDQLVTLSLIGMYAQANGITPQVTTEAIIANDMKQIGSAEFGRKLRREGLDVKSYGKKRMKEIVFQTAVQTAIRPVAVASATDDAIKNYYEVNKFRFKQDDEVSFENLLISPNDFIGKSSVSEEDIKKYYDEHRAEFMSSERLQLRHIYVNPKDEAFLADVKVAEQEVRRKYTDNLSKYKSAPKVQASHILIKPKNTFNYEFPNFKANVDGFKTKKVDEKNLYSFHIGMSALKSSADVGFDSIAIITEDDQMFYPTDESQKNVDDAIALPLTASTKPAVFGNVGILIDNNSTPKKLEIKDGAVSYQFDISSSFSEDKAFAAAEIEAKALLTRVQNNEDFATLAKEFSGDVGSARKGGDLGEFGRGAMVKPFEDAAFNAKEGDIVGPIKSRFGYHIIKVVKKVAEKVKSLDEVRAQLLIEVREEKAALKAEASLHTAKQKLDYRSSTFDKMVVMYSMGESRKNGGKLPLFFTGYIGDDYSSEQQKMLKAEIGTALQGEIGGSADAKIDPKIEKVVFELTASSTSEVITTDKGCHLFVLDQKFPAIQLSLTNSLKDKIRKIVEEDKLDNLAKVKAYELASKIAEQKSSNNVYTIETIAKEYKSDMDVKDITFGPLPFSKSPGNSSSVLAGGVGKYSSDGRTYVAAVHKAIMALSKDSNWKGKIVGPVKSALGYHFVSITAYEGGRYDEFADVKEKIKRMMTLEPTEEAIQEAFKKDIDKFDKPAERHVREIVVEDEVFANKLYKRLQDGEIFSLLAKTHSIDGSAPQGGKVPAILKGTLKGDLEKAVWNLKKGEFSKPVKVSYGYVIVLLEDDEIPGKPASLTPQVRNVLKRQLKSQYQEEAISSFIKGLQKQAYVILHPDVLSAL